jgi:hypothetical protein
MKTIFVLSVFAVILQVSEALSQQDTGRLNKLKIEEYVEQASTKFSNRMIYVNEKEWIGATVCVGGTFNNRLKPVLHVDRPYEEFIGNKSNAEIIDLIVFYDPKYASNPAHRNDTLWSAISGYNGWAVGTIKKCVEVVSYLGVVKKLPVMELMLVFYYDQKNNRRILYASQEFRN